MRVTFSKLDAKRLGCSWEALVGKRTRVPGSTMGVGAGLPHDIGQYVIEAAAGYGCARSCIRAVAPTPTG